MPLVSLPVEILQLICRFILDLSFFYNCSHQIANLAKCCRCLYTTVSPYIYSRVDIGPKATFLLIRSIFEKPSLALCIRDVTILPPRPKSGAIDLGRAYNLLRKPGVLPRALTRHLHPKDTNAIYLVMIEILLLQISRVERLSINVTAIGPDSKLFDKKRWRTGNLALPARLYLNLKDLKCFTHITCEEERDIIEQMRNLIGLCQPLRLSIDASHPLMHDSLELKLLPSLQNLDINCEGMTPWGFKKLLEACPNVRSLTYSCGKGPPEWHHMFDDAIEVRELCEILRIRQHSLLTLGIQCYYEDGAVVLHENTIPDLSQWSQLKKLELDAEALEDVDPGVELEPWTEEDVKFLHKLPSSLEVLSIFRADDRHLKELRSLARRKNNGFPNIGTLILEWWNGETEEPPADLETQLVAAGIELVIQ